MKRDEGGYIVVETIGSFLLFVFLMTSVLSLINIVTVQARVHYALTQTAQTVSMYTYVLDAAGVADHLQASAQRGEKVEEDLFKFQTNVNDVLKSIEELNIDGIKESGGAAVDQVKDFGGKLKKDPKAIFQDFMNLALQELSDTAFAAVIPLLLDHYLANGEMSGDEYLERFGVIDGLSGIKLNELGLVDFDWEIGRFTSTSDQSSAFLTGNGDVKIVVRYKIDYTFGALPLPFTQLEIKQEVITKSWLSGLGEGYQE
ncbi:MAG: hypothetical protein IJ955_03830 [Oscillospiraceae bacterium]|nr:hypothetical protein [Oscillospiraceae bacterium]